jgi:hypothetical protein
VIEGRVASLGAAGTLHVFIISIGNKQQVYRWNRHSRIWEANLGQLIAGVPSMFLLYAGVAKGDLMPSRPCGVRVILIVIYSLLSIPDHTTPSVS